MIYLRVPNFTRIGTRIRTELTTAAEQSASEDIDARAELMLQGLAPDGSVQKGSRGGGNVPLVQTGRLASRAGWTMTKTPSGVIVKPASDREEPVRRLTKAGFRIVEIATKTKAAGRQKVADTVRRLK